MSAKSYKAFALAAMAGTLLQFGGCINLNRLLNSIVDHTVFNLVSPLLPDLSGVLGGA